MAGFRDFLEYTKAKADFRNSTISLNTSIVDLSDSQSLWYDSDE